MIHAPHPPEAPAFLSGLLPAFNRAVFERVTLLLNHVVAAEPEAVMRLQAHVGSAVRVLWQGVPSWLPSPPALAWRVTPAGLFELAEPDALLHDALLVTLEPKALFDWSVAMPPAGAPRPAPPMDIQGDAAFASTLSWLAQHLRWDIEDDLAKIIGDVPARWLGAIGSQFAAGLRSLLNRRAP